MRLVARGELGFEDLRCGASSTQKEEGPPAVFVASGPWITFRGWKVRA
jgi:hypothetical protein